MMSENLQTNPEDLRRHPRHPIKVSVELTFLDEPYSVVQTRDISQGGMFIEVNTAEKFPVGELVNLHFLDPLNDNEDTFKDAMIVHVGNDGFGVSYIEMTEFDA
jgi:c-di-GMP-binding flagellar brake protein YcgR